MRKFQFFLLVEAVLLALALMTILADDLYSFLLILVVVLLALRFYNIGNRNNILLTSGLLLLFLIFMLNPFVILAILLALVYMLINYFAQAKHKNRYALVAFKEESLTSKGQINQWLGINQNLSDDAYAFDDINILRLSGTDIIDLTQVILTGCDNVVIIRKVYGPTQIRVPIDVDISLDVSAIYGTVSFLDLPDYDLRNESLKLQEENFSSSKRKVKVLINLVAGRVEVKRV